MSATILEAIDNLITAVTQLSAKMQSVGLAISVQGCGCNVGVGPDNEGTDGETVPEPIGDIIYYEPDPDPPYNRKCRIAEVMWNAMSELLAKWDVWNADTYAQIGLTGFVAAIGATLGLLSLNPLVIIAGAVGGAALGIALALIGVGFDADDMIDFWTTRKDDIICALYQSTSTADARNRLQAVMDDFAALSVIEEGIINLVLSNAVLSTLFFDTDAVIAYIDGFTPTFDCTPCSFEDCDWIIASDTLDPDVETASGFMGSGTPTQDGSTFVITAVTRDGGTYVVGMVTRAFAEGACGIFANGCACTVCAPLRLEAITALGSWSKWGVGCAGSPGLTGAGGANLPPTTAPNTMTNRVYVYWQNPSPFTVTLRVMV